MIRSHEFVNKAHIRNLHPPRDKGHSHDHFANLSITHTTVCGTRGDGVNNADTRLAGATAIAVSRFLGYLLNDWQSPKPRIFKALAPTKGPF